MLENIVFCIYSESGDTDDQNDFDIIAEQVSKQVDSAIEYLNSCGYYCRKRYVTKSRLEQDDLLLDICSVDKEINLGKTLFITDSINIADDLKAGGAYVMGFLHEGNQDEKFTGLKYVFTDIDEIPEDSYIKVYQRLAHLPWKVLETERCIIRETTVEDVDSFYEIYSEPEMTKYIEGLFENPEDEKRYTRDYIEKVYSLLGFGNWTVVCKANDRIIGRAGFSIRNGFDNVELGFLIAVPYQRKGYAYEVCSAIMDYGRDILQFDTVQTFVKKENAVSIHLCRKLGFEILDEQDIEENIYGDVYDGTKAVALNKSHYGRYIRMIWHA
ncbi:MAG: GNAT family N-acetyltransferase [Butyrivibrio sp.]|nr:GNAT family N-acetyltransferase [Butyrivibrio sp.]